MPSKPTVSAVLIVKDEEAVLAACLESVAWADQIVVYDTGSTDRTVEIARRFTDVVVEGYWDDDFSAARNRALACATGGWVLSIDADEVFEGDHVRMREIVGRGDAVLYSVLQRNVAERPALPLGLEAPHSDLAVPRVFRRADHVWSGRLHEQPVARPGTTAVPGIAPLPNVRLRHVGYTAEVVGGKDKAERNVAIAQAMVDEGQGAALPVGELEGRQIHLARSLVVAGRLTEALALGDEVIASATVTPSMCVILARSMWSAAWDLGDRAATDRWLRVWEANDTNPAFARAARAKVAALRGDAAAALEAVEGIPTTTRDGLGVTLDRSELVTVEVWARCALGQTRRAARTAQDAARRGVSPGAPEGLVQLLGHDWVLEVLGVLTDRLWREYVTWCVMAASPESLQFLRWMHEVRPGDTAVLSAVAMLTPILSLEDAATWAVDFRGAGLAEQCPLVGIAQDERLDPRQRALAGALSYSAYGDQRALPALEDALALVEEAHHQELLMQLQVVAPGLVTSGVPA